jgi:hypothetical protein
MLACLIAACICFCRQQLEQERRSWEQQLQRDVQAQQTSLQEQHQHQLWSLQQQLEGQARDMLQGLRQEYQVRAALVQQLLALVATAMRMLFFRLLHSCP